MRFLFLAIWLTCFPPAFAQAQTPVQAPAQLIKLYRAQGRPTFMARRDFDFFRRNGGCKAHSILSSSDYRIEVLVQRKKDSNWMKLTMETEPDTPHYARNFGFSPAQPPAQ